MSRDMDARPQTAATMEVELRRCLGRPFTAPRSTEEGPSASPSGPLGRASAPAPAQTQAPVAVGVAGASSAAGQGYFHGSSTGSPTAQTFVATRTETTPQGTNVKGVTA